MTSSNDEMRARAEAFLRMIEQKRRERAQAERTGGESTPDAAPQVAGPGDMPPVSAEVARAAGPSPLREGFPRDPARLATTPRSGPWAEAPMSVPLPSGGHWQPEGNVTLNPVGRVDVYPLTARDEVLLYDPAALLTGTAVRDVIARCVPSVRDPNVLPVNDVRVLLLAIRCVSYGETWDLEVTCPQCSHRWTFGFHIPTALADVGALESEYRLEVRPDVVFELRPFPWFVAHQAAVVGAEELRVARTVLAAEDMPEEERRRRIEEITMRLHDATIDQVARGGVRAVIVGDERIEDPKDIGAFLAGAPPTVWRRVHGEVERINTVGLPPRATVVCPAESCGHPFEVDVVYDPVRFFSMS